MVEDPENPGGERVKILDFGIAKFLNGDPGKQTSTGMVLGTPKYISPEQCDGRDHLSGKTDVYSLGIIIYEMLAGAAPFHAKAAMAFMRQHMVAEPPPLRSRIPEVPKELSELVHCMLAKEPQARPDMAQVVEQLRKIQSPARYRDTLLVPDPPRGRGVAWWLVGATVALLALAGALWVAWGRLFPSLPSGPTAAPTLPTPTPTLGPTPPLKPTPSPRPDLGSPRVTAPPPVAGPADAASGEGPLDAAASLDGEAPPPADLEPPPRAAHEPTPPEPVEPAPTPRPVAHPVKRPPSKPAARPEVRRHGGKRGKRPRSH